MTHTITFSDRAFQLSPMQPAVELSVERLIWSAIGGPDQAMLRAQGNENNLWDLVELLRCPVQIYQGITPVWWGYVEEVLISAGGVSTGVSLAGMYNTACVEYTFRQTTGSRAGQRRVTAWGTVPASVLDFGTRARFYTGTVFLDSTAITMRDRALAEYGWPQGIPANVKPSATGAAFAEIKLKGWWHTLAWQYYAPTYSQNQTLQTSAMMENIASNAQFISGYTVTASGVSTNAYRNGRQTLQAELMALIDAGTSTNQRYIAEVDMARRLWVKTEPTEPEFILYRDGTIKSINGYEITEYTIPVGTWFSLGGVVPSGAEISRTNNVALQFAESVEWQPGVGMIPRFRGSSGVEAMFALGR